MKSILTLTVENVPTCPGSGGGMRVTGSGGTGLPHSLQNLTNGSAGRAVKQ